MTEETANNEHSGSPACSLALAALDTIERQIKERWDQADADHSACIMASMKDDLAGRCRAYHVAWSIVTNEKRKLERTSESGEQPPT